MSDQSLKFPQIVPYKWIWTLKALLCKQTEMFGWNVPLALLVSALILQLMIKNTNPAQWPALPQRVEPPSPQSGPSVTSMCASHHGCSCCTLQREGDTSERFDTELVPWHRPTRTEENAQRNGIASICSPPCQGGWDEGVEGESKKTRLAVFWFLCLTSGNKKSLRLQRLELRLLYSNCSTH